MILWECQIKYKDKKTNKAGIKHLITDEDSKQPEKDWDGLLRTLNKRYGTCCDPDNMISVYFCGGIEGCLDIMIAHPIKKISVDRCFDFIRDTLMCEYAVRDISFENCRQISARRFDFLGNKADDNGYIRFWNNEKSRLKIDYFSNNQFKVEEYLEEKEYEDRRDALRAGSEIMADITLTEEIERIYSDRNIREYFGNPVHYKISATNFRSAMDIIDIIMASLTATSRLCGKRLIYINNISDGCYNETDLDHLFESAQGNAVVLEMSGTDEDHGNYASAYQRVVNYIYSVIEKYHLNTLCFFVELRDTPGFTQSLMAKVAENLQVITINEGAGDRSQAHAYLLRLAQKDKLKISDDEISELLAEGRQFSVEDLCNIYAGWFKNGLRTHYYKAYSEYVFDTFQVVTKSSAPYEDLQNMIGLNEIKHIVDEIIDAGRIRKLRQKRGLATPKASLHMIFTGNPGSAKTTVARLIAQILKKEGIVDDGKYVECGRADLISRFVGWTAKNVRAKFREARGGVLFIDEAYSLVDDSHSFADEAINTIVQEMENHREDVIVIFAGYPDKMEEFLDKNEGLKSRIAFHLDFPDYNPDELVGILKLMADERGYNLDKDVIKKCRDIFACACNEPDFGNGRFVRNLLEQAEMAQAHRIASQYAGKRISKKTLQTFVADDFNVNAQKTSSPARIPIGFAV